MAAILIAIKPEYVKLILAGTKRFELRKRSSGIRGGDILAIYCTRPRSALLATCVVSQVIVGSPTSVYEKVNGSAGIERSRFREYFLGEKQAYAMELEDVTLLDRPISLKELRTRVSRFVVPRSYRFITGTEARRLGIAPNGVVKSRAQIAQ